MVRSIAIAAALSCACGAGFVEPNPPRLVHARIDYAGASATEPAVWLLVSDLFLEHDEDCAATVAWLSGSVGAAVPASVPGTLALPPLQTSPCTQPNSRTIDPSAIDAALQAGEAAFPGRAVRTVIVYANNVVLSIPAQIAASLEAVRQLAVARGALEPRIWAILPASFSGRLRAERTLLWTFAGDPAIARGLLEAGADELPFTSDAGLPAGPFPLFARGPAGVLIFKVCDVDPGVELIGFPKDGSPVEVDAGNPPQYRVALSPQRAVPRSQFQPGHAGLDVEACLGHCDRYFGDAKVRWLTRQGCLLAGGPS